MLKKDLIKNVAALTGHPQNTVREILDGMCDVTTATLVSGDSVMLAGLGRLSVSRRGPKKARNLKTGEAVIVPARNAILMSPSDGLVKAVNG